MRVEGRERLVEEEHVRIASERPRQTDPLALPARELARPRTTEVGDPEPVEHRIGERPVERAEADVLRHVEVREERVLLEEVTDAPTLGRQIDTRAWCPAMDAVDLKSTLPRRHEPGDHAQHGGLPGTGGADQRGRRAARNGQLHRCYEGTKGMGEVEFERHRENSLTSRSRPALTATSTALIASATSKSRSNCS